MWHPGAEAGGGCIVHPGGMDALLSFCGNKELGDGVCLFRLSLSSSPFRQFTLRHKQAALCVMGSHKHF
jgi:hypothetical protein